MIVMINLHVSNKTAVHRWKDQEAAHTVILMFIFQEFGGKSIKRSSGEDKPLITANLSIILSLCYLSHFSVLDCYK